MDAPLPPGQKRYYYCTDSINVVGPVPADDLLGLLREGVINMDTPVCAVGSEEWITAETVPDSAFSSAAKSRELSQAFDDRERALRQRREDRSKAFAKDWEEKKGRAIIGFTLIGFLIIALIKYFQS